MILEQVFTPQLLILFFVSFISNVIFIKLLIPFLHKLKYGQTIRIDGPQTHLKKQGTPTMGGVVFVPLAILSVILVYSGMFGKSLLGDGTTQAIIFVMVGYFLIGFVDDYLIVVKKDNEGLNIKQKLFAQSVIALIFIFVFLRPMGDVMEAFTSISIPIINYSINLGWFFPVFVFMMFVGSTNAVNFTDGLDGLASGTMILALIPLFLFGYHLRDTSVQAFSLSMIAALLAFLVYNHHPAKIMMGDTGSLPLGALLAALFIVTKQELLFLVIGGVFVMEIMSSILQIGSYKLRNKKRIFRMAPIHHHFELGGWSEQRVVYTFWAIGAILAVVGYFMGVPL